MTEEAGAAEVKTRRMVLVMNFLFFVLMTLVLILAGFFGYVRFFGTAPLEYPSLPFEVVTDNVAPGETISLIVFRCNVSKIPIIVNTTRNLLNVDTGETFVLAATSVELEPGCHRSKYSVDMVPSNAPAGSYVLFGKAIVNDVFHEHTLPWYSERFTVTK